MTSDPYRDLDSLYLQVLLSSLGKYSHHALVQRVITTVVLAAVPLTIDTLGVIIGEDVNAVIRSLSSVLLVPTSARAAVEPVRAFHPSFRDFLTDKTRCTDARFAVDSETEHGRLAARCFERMLCSLNKDVCGIGDPSRLNSDIPDLKDRITKRLPGAVLYACMYWHLHLVLASGSDPILLDLYTSFCSTKLLCWIEAVSLIGFLGPAHSGLVAVQRSCPVCPGCFPPTAY
jgi:hypothetical protein